MSAPLRVVRPSAADDDALIRLHVDWLRRTGASAITQKYRREVLGRLCKALPGPLLGATFDDLDRWQAELTVGVSTIAGYSSHVRCFYRWAVDNGRLDVDPSLRLPSPKVPKRFPRPIPEADLQIALACAPEPLRTWLVLAAFMGLRAMEVAGMTAESVVELDRRLYLEGIGKGDKPYRLPVPEHVVPILRQHLAGRTGRLWRTAPGRRPSRPIDVSAQVATFFRRIGMNYTLHMLRHSFGTTMYRQTRDLLLVQDCMRHESPVMTRLYVQTSSPEATAAMDRLSARLDGAR